MICVGHVDDWGPTRSIKLLRSHQLVVQFSRKRPQFIHRVALLQCEGDKLSDRGAQSLHYAVELDDTVYNLTVRQLAQLCVKGDV